MQYFNKDADKQQRIGQIIGDLFSAFIVITLIAVFTQSMISR